MVSIISALFLTFSSLIFGLASLPAMAQPSGPLTLAENAPDRHVVVPGDTLWGISAKFLKEPYRWPEIWHLNQDQIRNPQLIYPGQVVILDRSGKEPQLKIGRAVNDLKLEPHIYVTDNKTAIPSISQQVIEPFLSEPLVVEANTLDHAPRIVATQEDRVYVGAGNLAYATGVKENAKLWQIYRPGKALVDPDSKETLGFEAVFLGSARLTQDGEPSTFEIISSRQEVGRGDRLLPAPPPMIINYAPHAPGKAISGRIISVYGGIGEGGRYSIVALSRGLKDGLEVGHVMAIYRSGREVSNRFEGKQEVYKLPDERSGLLFIFRVFDRVSYALVMDVSRPVAPGDLVRSP